MILIVAIILTLTGLLLPNTKEHTMPYYDTLSEEEYAAYAEEQYLVQQHELATERAYEAHLERPVAGERGEH